MRLRFMIPVLGAMAAAASGWAQVATTLLDPGVYYAGAGGPVRMAEAPAPAFHTQSFGAFLLDVSNTQKLEYEYEGSTSPILVGERRPAFRVNLGFDGDRGLRRVEIVRLERKGSVREAHLVWRHDTQSDFRHTVRVALNREADGSYTVRPAEELHEGEYLLSLGPLVKQYDFSVR